MTLKNRATSVPLSPARKRQPKELPIQVGFITASKIQIAPPQTPNRLFGATINEDGEAI